MSASIRSLLAQGRDACLSLGNYSSNFLSSSKGRAEPGVKEAAEKAIEASLAYRQAYDNLLTVLEGLAEQEDPKVRLLELLPRMIRRFEECPDAYLEIHEYFHHFRSLAESSMMTAELGNEVKVLADVVEEYWNRQVRGDRSDADSGPLVELARKILAELGQVE